MIAQQRLGPGSCRWPEVDPACLPGGQPFAKRDLSKPRVDPCTAQLVSLDRYEELLGVGLAAEVARSFRAGGVAVADLPLTCALLADVCHIPVYPGR